MRARVLRARMSRNEYSETSKLTHIQVMKRKEMFSTTHFVSRLVSTLGCFLSLSIYLKVTLLPALSVSLFARSSYIFTLIDYALHCGWEAFLAFPRLFDR